MPLRLIASDLVTGVPGRPPGQPPPEYAARWIRYMRSRQKHSQADIRAIDGQICRLVYELLKRPEVSVQSLATDVGVSKTTVQEWHDRGRELADTDNG